jgi:hypothetical protein
MIVFDFETGPLPLDYLRSICPPFEAPAHPGVFDPSTVAYGNTKDEAKRAVKLAECQAKHAAAVASYDRDVEVARANHFDSFVEKAALDPTTGQVLAIGYLSLKPDGQRTVVADDAQDDNNGSPEHELIMAFWRQYTKCHKAGRKMVGLNILGFDLPFLVRRSWMLGIDVPQTVRNGRYFDPIFVDIRDVWLCGQRWGECESSLNAISRALGVGEKNGNGAHFAELLKTDREAAMSYLRCDLELTVECATRMGVI